MNDEELLRYSRHILLPEIDIAGQDRLRAATVLIVGLGGLGSPVAMYLAAAGVGQLLLADGDTVDLDNLQRQIIHHTGDIGRPKVVSARERLQALNPDCRCLSISAYLTGEQLTEAVRQADVVVDASDNFATRFAVNAACFQEVKPLVSGAASRYGGQLAVFDPRMVESPCYACLYDEAAEAEQDTCAHSGVVAPLVGVIGSMQALEVVKLITSSGQISVGRLLIFDGWTMRWSNKRLRKDKECRICMQNKGK